MANQEKYAQQMQDAGVCDARGAALCATVKELPDGSFGMVLLANALGFSSALGAFMAGSPSRSN